VQINKRPPSQKKRQSNSYTRLQRILHQIPNENLHIRLN